MMRHAPRPRVQEDTISETLAQPGIVVYDLLHRVKRNGHTYADSRRAIVALLSERVLILDDAAGRRIYFNRNGPVYRGLTN